MKRTAPPLRGSNETNVSTKQSTTQAHPRLPGAHGHGGRPPGAQAPPRQGPQTPDGHYPAEAAALSGARRDQRLPRTRRIRKRTEFLRLQRVGERCSGARFVVITEARRESRSRLGITASRHVGGAVVRNRVKRLVREFFRRYQSRIVPARDVLVIARPSAARATYVDVKKELGAALAIDVLD